MYKILIISDTHKKLAPVMKLIERITDLNHIIHLGDMVSDAIDLEAIYDIPIDYVAGNCDFFEHNVPTKNVVVIKGKRFFITHGHNHGVKYSLETLRTLAKQNSYDAIFFGHTHTPILVYEGDTIIMNPGSLSQPRNYSKPSFGIIEIDREGTVHAGLNEF